MPRRYLLLILVASTLVLIGVLIFKNKTTFNNLVSNKPLEKKITNTVDVLDFINSEASPSAEQQKDMLNLINSLAKDVDIIEINNCQVKDPFSRSTKSSITITNSGETLATISAVQSSLTLRPKENKSLSLLAGSYSPVKCQDGGQEKTVAVITSIPKSLSSQEVLKVEQDALSLKAKAVSQISFRECRPSESVAKVVSGAKLRLINLDNIERQIHFDKLAKNYKIPAGDTITITIDLTKGVHSYICTTAQGKTSDFGGTLVVE